MNLFLLNSASHSLRKENYDDGGGGDVGAGGIFEVSLIKTTLYN